MKGAQTPMQHAQAVAEQTLVSSTRDTYVERYEAAFGPGWEDPEGLVGQNFKALPDVTRQRLTSKTPIDERQPLLQMMSLGSREGWEVWQKHRLRELIKVRATAKVT